MGGNMALLRSSVEGDVERLMRSKNECLHYYFSELKLWNPGLFAVQREAWIQVYGIPLHIWGDDFFKLVGNKLGVFLDYDEEPASMLRFDVARLKILTAAWACIDEVVKVEVEGVCFNLWVVEERGRGRSVVVIGGEKEDERSEVVPSESFDEAVDGGLNSGEDEESGEERDVDVRKPRQHGGNQVENNDMTSGVQVTIERDILLTCEKSTNIPNSQKEILFVHPRSVGNEETVIGHVAKETVLAASSKGEVKEISSAGGTKNEADGEKEEIESGGPPPRV
jgi:hypothetical protein